jgi:biopolymer transport protein ExbB
MLSNLFLGISLAGAEWVLYLLIAISVGSVAVIIERFTFYRAAERGLGEFRLNIRSATLKGQWDEALKTALNRKMTHDATCIDLETAIATALLQHKKESAENAVEVLNEIAQDEIVRARLAWEKNLAILSTIGANAPFIGLFGTVLGIIKAFHDLSQSASGAQTVSAGVSEALVATAVGILVAIPAVVAFNLFNRKVKSGVAYAESMKSFLIGKMGE